MNEQRGSVVRRDRTACWAAGAVAVVLAAGGLVEARAEVLPDGVFAFFDAIVEGEVEPGDDLSGFTDLPDETWFWDIANQLLVGDIDFDAAIQASGDPFYEFTMTVMNTNAAETRFFTLGMSFDMMDIEPPGATMRLTLDMTAMDLSGDGGVAITPLGGPIANMFLSDDRTNFVTTAETSFVTAGLTEDGVAVMFDSGVQPVPAIPAEYTKPAHGVMGFQAAFDLSPGDSVLLSGRLDIFPASGAVIPGPAALPGGLALLVLMGMMRGGGRRRV